MIRSLRRDALGEVCLGQTAAGAAVRIRFAQTDDIGSLARRLERLAEVRSPLVAPMLDRLTDQHRRVAVISPADAQTLSERRRRGPLDAVTSVPLGQALLEGLAALHTSGIAHGAAHADAVGIDARGRPRWQDAAIAPPPADGGEAADVTSLAAAIRDAGGLPATLARLADHVASGVPGTPRTIAEFSAEWRRLAHLDGIAVPPPGREVELPGLLLPGRRPRQHRRVRLPSWTGRAVAIGLAVAAVAVVPVARLVPAGGPFLDSMQSYRPGHAGQTLTYSYRQKTSSSDTQGKVQLTVRDFATVSGVPTLTLVPAGSGTPAGLPLGLDGTTIRVQDGALIRSASAGSVRDLVEPLAPGSSWTDRRDSSAGFSTTEQRTLLGSAPLDEPSGHYERCAVVHLDASSSATASAGNSPPVVGTLWYCPGVGLARAVLSSSGESDTIDLLSSTG